VSHYAEHLPFGIGRLMSLSCSKFQLQCVWCRKERRLFDSVDTNHKGYVTLDEIISWRESYDMEGVQQLDMDLPLLTMQPDLTRSLVALYHFDVRLDGHLTFDEFLLMLDYLRKVDQDEDHDETYCWCLPKRWFRRKRPRRRQDTASASQTKFHVDGNTERILSHKACAQFAHFSSICALAQGFPLGYTQKNTDNELC
jgi:hypothetical protein